MGTQRGSHSVRGFGEEVTSLRGGEEGGDIKKSEKKQINNWINKIHIADIAGITPGVNSEIPDINLYDPGDIFWDTYGQYC